MKKAEEDLFVVPKAYTKLDEWILHVTNYRVVVSRFDAWGTALGGTVGWFLDSKKREKMEFANANTVLATVKKSYAIEYSNLTSIECKKKLTGGTITFILNDGEKKKFGMPKKDYLKLVDILSRYNEPKMNVK